MQVTAPDGRVWTVRRRWLPRYVDQARERWAPGRVRRRAEASLDVSGELSHFADELPLIGVVVGLVFVLALVFVALPLLVDAVIVLLAIVLGGLARVVLRRPWTVEASSSDGQRHTDRVVGWRRAGERVQAWADELRHGRSGQQPGADGPGVLP